MTTRSRHRPSPDKIIIMLQTLYSYIYITYIYLQTYILHAVHYIPWLIYSITESLYLSCTSSIAPNSPLPALPKTTSLLCLYKPICILFVHLFCVLDSTFKWDHVIFVFFWLILLSIMPLTSNPVTANGKISFFFMAEQYSILYIYIYTYIYHTFFIHSSINVHVMNILS